MRGMRSPASCWSRKPEGTSPRSRGRTAGASPRPCSAARRALPARCGRWSVPGKERPSGDALTGWLRFFHLGEIAGKDAGKRVRLQVLAQRRVDRRGVETFERGIELGRVGEGAADKRLLVQGRGKRRILAARKASLLQQRALGVGYFFGTETLALRALDLVLHGSTQALDILRREYRRDRDRGIRLPAAGVHRGVDAVAQALFLADAIPQPRIGRAAKHVIGEHQRRVVGIGVAER